MGFSTERVEYFQVIPWLRRDYLASFSHVMCFFFRVVSSIDAVVVAGPSGAGKGTIIRKLMELFPNQVMTKQQEQQQQ